MRDFRNEPLTEEQQELVDELLEYGDEDAAAECEGFFRGWNAAGHD